MALAMVRCDQCGQTDDHPMAHFGNGRSVHHDCMSVDEEQTARDSLQPLTQVAFSAIIDAARSGTHGDELRAFIGEQQADADTHTDEEDSE